MRDDQARTSFDALVDEFLRTEYEMSPVMASNLGLTDYDDRLDDLSADAFARRDALAEGWLARFGGVPAAGLGREELIDRDLVISVLRGRTILADWQAWRRDPLVYSGPVLNGIFGLFLHHLRPEGELVSAAASRLRQAPAALEAGRSNLDPALAHPLIVERGRNAARGGVRYLRDLLPNDVAAGPDRDRLVSVAGDAAEALERWAAFLGDFGLRAHGDWRLGEDRYTGLLREREALADDARSLRERGQAEWDRLDAEMRALSKSARGREDWPAVLDAAKVDHPATEAAMRAAYETWTAR
ncbi:MAG TPA: DUF885 family protein, partial [Candidatus Limnocylindrales bacterium]